MEQPFSPQDERTPLRSWAIVTAIVTAFLCWGFFLFFAVGDKGQPGWDFSIVEDIPGQSPYSTHRLKQFYGSQPPLEGQHVPGVTPPPPAPMNGGKP